MNHRFHPLCAVVLALLLVFLATASEAREDLEEEEDGPKSERAIVYDYKSGTFVGTHRAHFSDDKLGKVKVNVGYEEQATHARKVWPETVTRFLINDPFGP